MKVGDKVMHKGGNKGGIIRTFYPRLIPNGQDLIMLDDNTGLAHYASDWSVVEYKEDPFAKPIPQPFDYNKVKHDLDFFFGGMRTSYEVWAAGGSNPLKQVYPPPLASSQKMSFGTAYELLDGRLPVLEEPYDDQVNDIKMYDYAQAAIDFKLARQHAKSCECGSESVGSNAHSSWCPKVST